MLCGLPSLSLFPVWLVYLIKMRCPPWGAEKEGRLPSCFSLGAELARGCRGLWGTEASEATGLETRGRAGLGERPAPERDRPSPPLSASLSLPWLCASRWACGLPQVGSHSDLAELVQGRSAMLSRRVGWGLRDSAENGTETDS